VKRDDAEELTESIGQHLTASWRQIELCHRLDVPKTLGFSNTREWVEKRLGGYVKMSVPDRREAVRELTEQGHSAREAAEIVGISHETAAKDVRNLTTTEATPEPAPTIDPAEQRRREAASVEENKRETMIRLTESAYRGTLAWSIGEFVTDVRERLSDKRFRKTLLERVRADRSELKQISAGASALATLLAEVTERS
jgi:hypothetical protein